MSFLGADTAGVRAQARLMDSGAGRIEDLAVRLGSTLSTVQWFGPDGDEFEDQWRQRSREIVELILLLRRLVEELNSEADEQDRTSEGDGSAGALWDQLLQWLDEYEPLESDGFWGDLLGENGLIGLLSWLGITSAIDVVGMIPGNVAGDVLNIVADALSMHIAVYDGLQAFQDGDLFGVLDASITYGINALDIAVTAVGLFPHPVTVAIGQIGGVATGGLDIAWNILTAATAVNPESIGGASPTRALLEAPGVAVEALTGWSGLRDHTDTVLGGAEDLYGQGTELIRDAVPIIDPLIDIPQRIVEEAGSWLG